MCLSGSYDVVHSLWRVHTAHLGNSSKWSSTAMLTQPASRSRSRSRPVVRRAAAGGDKTNERAAVAATHKLERRVADGDADEVVRRQWRVARWLGHLLPRTDGLEGLDSLLQRVAMTTRVRLG